MNKFIILSLALLAIIGAAQAQNLGGFLNQAASLVNSDTLNAAQNAINSLSNGASSTANQASDLAAANIDANPSLTNLAADQADKVSVSTDGVQDSLNSAAASAGNTVGMAIAQPTDAFNSIADTLNNLLNKAQDQTVNGVQGNVVDLGKTIQNAADSLTTSLGYDLTNTTSDLLEQLNNATGIVSNIENITMNVNASDLLNNAGLIISDSNLGLANLSNLYSNLTNNVDQIVDLNAPFNGTYAQCVQESCAAEISSCYADNSCGTFYAQQQGCFSSFRCDTIDQGADNCYDLCLNADQTANNEAFSGLNMCAMNKCTYKAVVNGTGVYDILGNFFSNAYVNASNAVISVVNVANASELYNNVTMGVNVSTIAMNATDLYNNATGVSQSYLNLTSMGVMNATDMTMVDGESMMGMMNNMTMVDGETIVNNVNMTIVDAANSGLDAVMNSTESETMMGMMNNSN